METTPLVSVITPCHNHEQYIKETIESVIHQTYKNIEYFVIDDGSTDKSAEVIKALQQKHNFHFEVQQNKGLAFTMNKLFKKCNGKYIAILESDDVWTPDKIEKQVAYLEKNPNVAVCGGNALRINERNETLPAREQEIQKYTEYNFEDLMSFDFQINPLTIMMRKEMPGLIGHLDESIVFVDLYMWLKITMNKFSIIILPDQFGFYRIHKTNVHYNVLKMYKGGLQVLGKFKADPLYTLALRNIKYYYFPYLAVNQKKIALSILPKAFRFKLRIIKGMIVLLIPFPILKLLTKTPYS